MVSTVHVMGDASKGPGFMRVPMEIHIFVSAFIPKMFMTMDSNIFVKSIIYSVSPNKTKEEERYIL